MVTEMKIRESEKEGQEEIRRQSCVKETDQLRNL
jgi:hypothetical protein